MYEIETFHILIHSIYVSSDIYGRIYYILPWQNIIYSAYMSLLTYMACMPNMQMYENEAFHIC